MNGNPYEILGVNGFVVKDKSFMQEESDFSSYNKKIDSTCLGDFVDYLEYPHRNEIKSLLKIYYTSAEVNLFMDSLKLKQKMILKKIFI